MKEERNCGYPIYSNTMLPGPLPINGVNMPMPMPINSPMPYTNMTNYETTYENTETNSLNQRINSLEQRVSALENMMNSSYTTNYNTNNYQMM